MLPECRETGKHAFASLVAASGPAATQPPCGPSHHQDADCNRLAAGYRPTPCSADYVSLASSSGCSGGIFAKSKPGRAPPRPQASLISVPAPDLPKSFRRNHLRQSPPGTPPAPVRTQDAFLLRTGIELRPTAVSLTPYGFTFPKSGTGWPKSRFFREPESKSAVFSAGVGRESCRPVPTSAGRRLRKPLRHSHKRRKPAGGAGRACRRRESGQLQGMWWRRGPVARRSRRPLRGQRETTFPPPVSV
jgi:hypothetical protein